MQVKLEKHKDCGGYWLMKVLLNNEIDYRCTRCGKYKSQLKGP